MALPTNKFLARALREAQDIQAQIKTRSQALHDRSTTQAVLRSRVLKFYQDMLKARTALTAIRNVSGLNAYAQAQFDDGALDTVTEIDAIITALDATILWVDNNFPQSGGYALVAQMNSEGTFSSAVLAGFRVELLLLISSAT